MYNGCCGSIQLYIIYEYEAPYERVEFPHLLSGAVFYWFIFPYETICFVDSIMGHPGGLTDIEREQSVIGSI